MGAPRDLVLRRACKPAENAAESPMMIGAPLVNNEPLNLREIWEKGKILHGVRATSKRMQSAMKQVIRVRNELRLRLGLRP